MTTEVKRADRYTVIETDLDSLKGKLEACAELDLTYFVVNDGTFASQSGRCLLYVFFDLAGMGNYLDGRYGSKKIMDGATG